MGFRNANITAHMIKFNSATSSDFLAMYTELIEDGIKSANLEPKHRTFAPSQMRCDRVSWFRLRGTQPDKVSNPDIGLNFTAQIGTACHEIIQERLSKALGPDWISVNDWIAMNSEIFADYDMKVEQKGYESMIDLKKPYPVRFACDGIIRFNGKIRLLEIKTAEFSSLIDLTEPKPKHMDQITCYSALLHIPDALFLYQDRQHGDMKCFEVNFSEAMHQAVRNRMDNVMRLVDANIAPEGLPLNDPDCSSSMCPYYKVCKQWGR
jgi:hypothetical protein